MEFRLPEIGEGVYEAELTRWLVKPGESVKPGQALLEALTDKATMEVPAPFGGVIDELLIEPGAKIKIGEPILRYTDKKMTATKAESKAESPAAAPPTSLALVASSKMRKGMLVVEGPPLVVTRISAKTFRRKIVSIKMTTVAARAICGRTI